MNKTKVLVIDDDPMMLDLARYQLQTHGYGVTTAETGEEGLRLCADQHSDIVLTDLQLPDIDGIELVRQLKEAVPSTEIIMITGYSSVTGAIEAIRAGAFYFIEKALERHHQAEEIRQLRSRLTKRDSYFNIIGSSKAMQNIYETIDSVAESDANIMVIGESGTGKELIANAIHYKSHRSKKP